MKIITWNVRGLGDPSKRIALNLTLSPHKSDILLIQETKLVDPSPTQIRQLGGAHLSGWAHSNAIGSSGGLITLWNESTWSHCQTILHPSALHVSLRHIQTNTIYFFSNIYGPQNPTDRNTLWINCLTFATHLNGPWLLGGDFNTTRNTLERNSGNASQDSDSFNSFISSGSLIDPPINNRLYTWSNRRSDPSLAKLDRFLFNINWDDLHPLSNVSGLASTISDHCPLILDSGSSPNPNRPFRFERLWTLEPSFDNFI